MSEDIKTISIPKDKFLEIVRKLSYVENALCIDYKAYHEGLADVITELKPFLGDIEDKPSKKFIELNKKIFDYAHTHTDEFRKQEDEFDPEPHCQIMGCDREDGNCEGCPHCYSDEFYQPETKFTKLQSAFWKAFYNKEITKAEREELIARWKQIREKYNLQLESDIEVWG